MITHQMIHLNAYWSKLTSPSGFNGLQQCYLCFTKGILDLYNAILVMLFSIAFEPKGRNDHKIKKIYIYLYKILQLQ